MDAASVRDSVGLLYLTDRHAITLRDPSKEFSLAHLMLNAVLGMKIGQVILRHIPGRNLKSPPGVDRRAAPHPIGILDGTNRGSVAPRELTQCLSAAHLVAVEQQTLFKGDPG